MEDTGQPSGSTLTQLRYCDLVMKGGITSGLVYPRAVIEIGKRYRFRNIGGTSAGAIAAAFSAAAALGERRMAVGECVGGGFARLSKTATHLSTRGSIFELFQPTASLKSAYGLLVALSAKPSRPMKWWLIGSAGIRLAPLSFIVVLASLGGLAYLLAGWWGVAATALPSLACAATIALYRGVSSTASRLRSNLLGMCPGRTQRGRKQPGLSDWMHSEIRALAGRGEEDGPPVLVEDLWNAPWYPGEAHGRPGERTLTLEVITTDVSHSEPRTLPFTKGTLWFLRADMEKLFPDQVVEAMVKSGADTLPHGGLTYHRFPSDGSLPVVVAARMSLSFPALICAVRLYEQHFMPKSADADPRRVEDEPAGDSAPLSETPDGLTTGGSTNAPEGANYEMRPCWFTDGGVSSNFPLHMFDAPMPRWPTFAIDLVYPPEDAPKSATPVFLPTGNDQGWRPRYNTIDKEGGLETMGAFLFGIIGTMQNWRDLLQGRAPGHRDRIVQVEVAANEGGMNLNMGDDPLRTLAEKGELAGKTLEQFDFENHFWVRYRNLQSSIERYGLAMHRSLEVAPPGAEAAYDRARSGTASRKKPYPLTVAQAKEASRRLNKLLEEMELWEDWDDSLAKGAPNPPPSLRISPTF